MELWCGDIGFSLFDSTCSCLALQALKASHACPSIFKVEKSRAVLVANLGVGANHIPIHIPRQSHLQAEQSTMVHTGREGEDRKVWQPSQKLLRRHFFLMASFQAASVVVVMSFLVEGPNCKI